AEPKPASLLLTTPTNAELDKGNATFICIASQFSPNKFTFTWKLGHDVLSGKNRPEILTEDKSTKTFTAVSKFQIPANDWIHREEYTCQVTDLRETVKKSISVCTATCS
uniref:Ig-like domain-containing protein n=1 Tax=Astyanax mexicanus TaxID=7994 RepID=A0A8B9JZ87_ASTMX